MEIEKTFIPNETELKFKKIFKSLISDYYKQVIEREKEIFSLGIFTDSDISGFIMNYNVKRENNSESDKWWIPEWKSESKDDQSFYHEDDRYQELETIMNKLYKKSEWNFDEEKNTFALYKKEIFDSICEALKELKEENLFKGVTEDFLLLVQESDNGIYDGREISLKKIMSKEQFEAYLKFS